MRWIATDDLLGYIWATDHSFAVTRNAWTLYLGEVQYGSLGYDSTGLLASRGGDPSDMRHYAPSFEEIVVSLVWDGAGEVDVSSRSE